MQFAILCVRSAETYDILQFCIDFVTKSETKKQKILQQSCIELFILLEMQIMINNRKR